MKLKILSASLLAIGTIGAAQAQDVITTVTNPWQGWFAGANIGGAWNHTCDSWEPGPNIRNNPALANKFYNRNCPNNGNFIGGVDGGYNFQINQWVWGFKVDYEAVGSSTKSRSYTYVSQGPTDPIPPGTYTASGKVSPNGIILLGPRVGYSIDEFLPWVRIGGAFTSGSHNSELSYTPAAGSAAGPASFSGSKNSQNHGFNVGLGLDYGITGPWSFVAEYNYVKLSKGSNSDVNCSSSSIKGSSLCTAYGNFELDNIHNSFTMNMFRVGFHYNFSFGP